MSRTTFLLTLVAGVLLGGLLFNRPAPAPVSAQPVGGAATRWEYAELSSQPSGKKTWATPDKTVTANTWEDLMKKVGLKGNPQFPVLLSRFGSDGWELATHSGTSIVNGGLIQTTEHWTFKRPAK